MLTVAGQWRIRTALPKAFRCGLASLDTVRIKPVQRVCKVGKR